MTPPQLAAVLANGTLEDPSFQIGHGAPPVRSSAALGGGTPCCDPRANDADQGERWRAKLHGIDTFQAGVRQAWTGQEKDTLTSDGGTTLALLPRVDRSDQEHIGDRIDLVVPLFVAMMPSPPLRTIAVRAGRIALAGHEARTHDRAPCSSN